MDQVAEHDEQASQTTTADPLGLYLRNLFSEAEGERQQYEEGWLQDLRQFKGIYDPEVLARMHPKRSKAFVRLTRTKVRTMDARLRDLLFPSGTEKNWSIKPTPVPELPEFKKQQLQQQVSQILQAQQDAAEQERMMALEQGIDPGPSASIEPPTEEELETMADELAERASDKMEAEIDDQLTEGRYSQVAARVIHSGNLFGTGILKGPMVERRLQKRWIEDEKGQFTLSEKERKRPYFEFVPIWDLYPDMSATNPEDCEYFFQRHAMPKFLVRKLAKRRDFNGKRIRQYLRENPDGDSEFKNFEEQLRTINAKKDAVAAKGKRFEVLEYWGYVDGKMLSDAGVEGIEEEDFDLEFEANVWVLGNHVIKAVLNPTEQQQRPYHFYYFEKDETSIFGISIPSVMRDTQTMFNAAIRAAMDNAGHSAGPIVEVNTSLLADGESATEFHPFRVYARKGTGADATAPAVRVYQVPNYVGTLLKLGETFKQLGDEATTIPSYMHGENDQGVGKTVGGLSMLMGAANITLKDVVANFDDGITKPFISAMYHWNMQFGDKDDVKGDYQTVALGSTTLVAKEVRGQQLDNFAASVNNPFDDPWVKRGELLRERAKSRDAANVIKTDDEYERDMEARTAAAAAEAAAQTGGAMQEMAA